MEIYLNKQPSILKQTTEQEGGYFSQTGHYMGCYNLHNNILKKQPCKNVAISEVLQVYNGGITGVLSM